MPPSTMAPLVSLYCGVPDSSLPSKPAFSLLTSIKSLNCSAPKDTASAPFSQFQASSRSNIATWQGHMHNGEVRMKHTRFYIFHSSQFTHTGLYISLLAHIRTSLLVLHLPSFSHQTHRVLFFPTHINQAYLVSHCPRSLYLPTYMHQTQ